MGELAALTPPAVVTLLTASSGVAWSASGNNRGGNNRGGNKWGGSKWGGSKWGG